jgi:hypothetical protein
MTYKSVSMYPYSIIYIYITCKSKRNISKHDVTNMDMHWTQRIEDLQQVRLWQKTKITSPYNTSDLVFEWKHKMLPVKYEMHLYI